MTRLPTPGGDSGSWGEILNDFLSQEHAGDGTHGTITPADIKAQGPWVDVRNYGSFSAAITAIGPDSKTLLIPDEQAVSSDVSVPANIHLLFIRGGSLSISPGSTVTIHSPYNIIAQPNQQIFSGDGDIAFSHSGILYVNWYQENTIPGTTDMSVGIQAALDDAAAYGCTLQFLGEEYRFTTPITKDQTEGAASAPHIQGMGRGGPAAGYGLTVLTFDNDTQIDTETDDTKKTIALEILSTDNSARGLIIKDLDFKKTGSGNVQVALRLGQSHSFRLENVKVYGWSEKNDVGILIENCWEGTIEQCYSIQNSTGIKFTATSTVIKILGGSFKACDVGIHLNGNNANFYIEGTNLESCTVAGLKTDEGTATIIVTRGAHFEDSVLPVDLNGANSVDLHGYFSLHNAAEADDPYVKIEKCHGVYVSGYVRSTDTKIFDVVGTSNRDYRATCLGDNSRYMRLNSLYGDPYKAAAELANYQGGVAINADPFFMRAQQGASYRSAGQYPVGVSLISPPGGCTFEWTPTGAYISGHYIFHVTLTRAGTKFLAYRIPIIEGLAGKYIKISTIVKADKAGRLQVRDQDRKYVSSAVIAGDSLWHEVTLEFAIPSGDTEELIGWEFTRDESDVQFWVHSMFITVGDIVTPLMPNPIDVIRRYAIRLTGVGTTGVTVNLPSDNSNYIVAATPEADYDCWIERAGSTIVVKTDDAGDSQVVNVIILPLTEVGY